MVGNVRIENELHLGGSDKSLSPFAHRPPQSSQHALPRSPSKPSLPMIGTITIPATGSAHHHPNNAFRSKPPNRIADRYVQKSACLEYRALYCWSMTAQPSPEASF